MLTSQQADVHPQQKIQEDDLRYSRFNIERLPPEPPILLSQNSNSFRIPDDILEKFNQINAKVLTPQDLERLGEVYFRGARRTTEPLQIASDVNSRFPDTVTGRFSRASYLIDMAFNKAVEVLGDEYSLETYSGLRAFVELLKSGNPVFVQLIESGSSMAKAVQCGLQIFSELTRPGLVTADMVERAFSIVMLTIHPEGPFLKIAQGVSPISSLVDNFFGTN